MVISWALSHDRGATSGPCPDGEEDGMEDKWLLVVLVVAILYGASRLPSLGRNLGQGIKEFRKGIADAARDDATEDQADAEPATGSDVTPADDHRATPPA